MSDAAGHLVIAIDGPAASGKSSVARALARRLGFVYVNTGAMYRAATWHTVESGVSPGDAEAVAALLRDADIDGFESSILIGGVDPTPYLVTDAVNASVSQVATVPEVRRRLVALQRAYSQDNDIVMEGRDIGSAVHPETPYKFYIDASPEIRAQRRLRQGIPDAIATRDRIDTTRRTSPLVIAEDAHVIDSSNLTIEGVVGEIVGRLKMRGLRIEESILRVV